MSDEEKNEGTKEEAADEKNDAEKAESKAEPTEGSPAESTGQGETGGTEGKDAKEAEKPWKNADNARYAEMRRQNEELQRRIAQLESESKASVTDEALKDLGFSRDDLNDSENMEIAKAYVRALAKGAQNPKAEAYEQVYRSRREAQKEAEAEKQRLAKQEADSREMVEKDIADFARTYPNARISDVTNPNSDFMKAFGSVVTNGNVTKYYGIYLSIKGTPKIDEATKNRSNPAMSGSQSNGGVAEMTQKEILALPPDEYSRAMEKIRSGKLKLKH